jgi:hypothetical protein
MHLDAEEMSYKSKLASVSLAVARPRYHYYGRLHDFCPCSSPTSAPALPRQCRAAVLHPVPHNQWLYTSFFDFSSIFVAAVQPIYFESTHSAILEVHMSIQSIYQF